MALTDFKVFDTAIKEKARIKRVSNGEFVVAGGCLLSRSAAERYVDYVLFGESEKYALVLSRDYNLAI